MIIVIVTLISELVMLILIGVKQILELKLKKFKLNISKVLLSV